jgi:hypothetical protein
MENRWSERIFIGLRRLRRRRRRRSRFRRWWHCVWCIYYKFYLVISRMIRLSWIFLSPKLLEEMWNRSGTKLSVYFIRNRIGQTVSKEFYCYIFIAAAPADHLLYNYWVNWENNCHTANWKSKSKVKAESNSCKSIKGGYRIDSKNYSNSGPGPL